MKFEYKNIDLPIVDVVPEVREKLTCNNTLIVNAPPGAGKSTLLPLALMEEQWLDGQKILMLEPRRLAARTIAARMSDLLGTKLGKEVGFRIRFENRTSENTQIEVLTEGILTRLLHSDNSLQGVGMVVFDEFHERSIHADIALALCREAQQVLRPDIRILIMSATLDMPKLTELLNAPVVVSQGRQYPVEIIHTETRDDFMIGEFTAQTIIQASKEKEGDILAFLPGEGEIRTCEEILRKKTKGIAIHPLYGMLPQGKQFAAIMPDRNGKRKIVLATSIAETSLTIEGIKVVVDCGYGRTSKFDPKSSLSRLETVQISKDSADQRAGRAGRLSPGTCYRMWSKATHQRLAEHRTPEIEEADLAPLVLDMAKWGIADANELSWLSPPPKANLLQAYDTLEQLEALDSGKLTEHGKRIHALPCHPRIAHTLVLAKEEELLDLACDVAAILEERDPLPKDSGIDINLRIDALRRARRDKRLGKKMQRIEKVSASYRKMFDKEEDNTPVNPYETGLVLTFAYPERIAFARPGNNAQFQLANGRYAMAGHRDDLAHEEWLAVAHVDARDGTGKIFLASPLNPQDLAPYVKQKETIVWDSKSGVLKTALEMRIGSIVLQSRSLPDPDPELVEKALCEAIRKEGLSLLRFDDKVEQWQNRVLSLRAWHPNSNWPDVSTSSLLKTNEKWITPYLSGIRKEEDFNRLDLVEILNSSLSWEQQQSLANLAPERIEVPSGSNIKIKYLANGDAPILAVRLQEVFGLAETPTVNQGKTQLVMHLLSPGFKPVQVTSDLRSFWDNAYFEVRKELKRRYTKHAWPDDPWSAEAVRGVRRK